MASSYKGPVRILDPHDVLLTVGGAELKERPEDGSWGGTVRVIPNTGVAGKALQVKLELVGGNVGVAALDPRPTENAVAISAVAGIGPSPL